MRYDSHHPSRLKNNLPYSQFLRLKRNCSFDQDFTKESDALAQQFHDRGYPQQIIKAARTKTNKSNRQDLMQPKSTTSMEHITCVLPFNMVTKQLHKYIQQEWTLLQDLPGFSTRPIVSFKRTRNLRDWLVHSDHSAYHKHCSARQSTIVQLPRPSGFHPCGHCVYCKLTRKTTSFVSPDSGAMIHINDFMNCQTAGVIYVISCPCNLFYVGKTSRPLKFRVAEHLYNLRHNGQGAPLVNYFVEKGHSPESSFPSQ